MSVATITARPVKGNRVTVKADGRHAIVLAVAREKDRCKISGIDRDDVWVWFSQISVECADEQCWKCSGSGKFYAGGAVVNGVYTGKIGPCYGCGGNGVEDNDDRIRNLNYWRYIFKMSA